MALIYLLFLLLGQVPVILIIVASYYRWRRIKRTNISWRFQYHLSDVLIAALSLVAAAVFLHYIHVDMRTDPLPAAYFTAAIYAGLAFGKLWYSTSIRKRLPGQWAYMLVGIIGCLIGSLGPACLYIVWLFARSPGPIGLPCPR